MPRKSRPTADDLALKAGVLLLHAEAARIAEARRVAREAKGIMPASTSMEDVRQRIEARRAASRASMIAARARAEEKVSCRSGVPTRPAIRKPVRRQHAVRPEDFYSDSQYARFFGHEKPSKSTDMSDDSGKDGAQF